MQRLTENQRTCIEKLARDEGTTCEGCGSVRLRCGGAPHPRSRVDGLPVVRKRRPPSGGLPILHDPGWGGHRHLERLAGEPNEPECLVGYVEEHS
jgi:hypothetical protein